MSVAENYTTEQLPPNLQRQLAIGSAIGAVVLLGGLAFIFAGLPQLWSILWAEIWTQSLQLSSNVFLSGALLILVELVAITALVVGAYHLLQQHTQSGLRAGIFILALYFFATLWIGIWLGGLLEDQFQDNAMLGWIVLAVVVAALWAGAGYVYTMPAWVNLLEAVDHQGWFAATTYKGNQGVRVRRGSIVGILAVGAAGIITMVTYRYFGSERAGSSNDWEWILPFTDRKMYVPLMFKIHLMMPIVLGLSLLWIAWRVVNIPAFADFLIATEAEMNKVSWTTRRRLMKDTVVVLTTTLFLTAFLFVVDVIWIKVLSAPGIQVLLIDPKQEQQKQQEKAQW